MVVKPACFVNLRLRSHGALSQIADYGAGLSPEALNPEDAVEELVSFLPVLAYDGSHMTQIDAGEILDIAMSGTCGLARSQVGVGHPRQRRQRHTAPSWRTKLR